MATVDKNVAAAIFWMKARAGWREVQQLEQLGADGKPMDPRQPFVFQVLRD